MQVKTYLTINNGTIPLLLMSSAFPRQNRESVYKGFMYSRVMQI